MTPTHLGVALASILHKKRPLSRWNLYYRSRTGNGVPCFPGVEAEDEKGESYVPFFAAFTNLFKEGELQKTLPRKVRECVRGTFIFKVSLDESIWRKIALSGEHALEDLHLAIQDAFRFDNDHLYAFFMDGKRWPKDAFYHPHCDEGPYADQISLGEMELVLGKEFLYLFDFGDEWHFWIELLEIRKGKSELSRP